MILLLIYAKSKLVIITIRDFFAHISDWHGFAMVTYIPLCLDYQFHVTECRMKFKKSEVEFDKQIPIYSKVTSGNQLGDLVTILLKSDFEQVWTVQPLSFTENASFVIDIDAVDFHVLEADDLGSWSVTETKRSFVSQHL